MTPYKEAKMDLFQVNKTTCNRDGICAACCPAQIISLSSEGYPEPVEEAEELCIRCGQCVAVCPTASFTHRDMPVEECPSLDRDMLPTPQQCEHFFRARRSIRTYKDEIPDPDRIQRLIEMARYAPTGHNSQCVEWAVLGDRNELWHLADLVVDWMRWMMNNMPQTASAMHMGRTVQRWEDGEDVIFRGAPMLILAHANKDLPPAPAACTIATAYLELAAPTMGLGGCWAGYFMAAAGYYQPLQEALPLPQENKCFAAMMMGHPRYSYYRLPLRKPPPITLRLP
jgi:nitroreductase/NAD-dependent dihydropyrimidine dehydrogenase PreA subunit